MYNDNKKRNILVHEQKTLQTNIAVNGLYDTRVWV